MHESIHSVRLVAVPLAVALALAVFAPSSGAGGSRIVATVDEPFEIDGRRFPAGSVSLREVARYSPTLTLNEVWVGDEYLGRLPAAVSGEYWGLLDDALLFERTPDGHLDWVGFALRGREAREFRFVRSK